MNGFVVFAHGSRVAEANDAVRTVARRLSEAGDLDLVEPAFLELAEPDLAGAVQRLRAHGAKRIVVLPYFLTLGTHLQRDLPRIAEEIRRIYEGITIEITEPLDGHPGLLQALLDRSKEALDGGSGSERKVD